MGDDATSTLEKEIELDDHINLREFLDLQKELFPLARIWGGKATWAFTGNQILAVIAEQWASPKLLVDDEIELREFIDTETKGFTRGLYFQYWGQCDPDIFFQNAFETKSLPEEKRKYPPDNTPRSIPKTNRSSLKGIPGTSPKHNRRSII